QDGTAPSDAWLRDRLLGEDGPLREDVRDPHVAWPRAPLRDRREAREPPTEGPLPQRRRRRPGNRRRPLRERGSPEPGHAVHHPRQRRVWPDERPSGADIEAP